MSNGKDPKETIRKLLALANDDQALGNEIENALRFARKLMLEHNITEESLNTQADQKAAEIEYEVQKVELQSKGVLQWESLLGWAVVNLIGTIGHYIDSQYQVKRNKLGIAQMTAAGAPKRIRTMAFYGPQEDVEEASRLYLYWAEVITSMAKLRYGAVVRGEGRPYCEGFAMALYNKVQKILQEEKTKTQITGPESTALVRIHLTMETRKAQAKIWLKEEKGIKVGGRAIRSNNSYDRNGAYQNGQDDGSKAEFKRESKARQITA